MDSGLQKIYSRMDNSSLLQCIRSGLILMIPVLLIGSFALVLRSLPIPIYQKVITTFLSGALYELIDFIYQATFGFLAVYMTISISICYARRHMEADVFGYGPVFTALICFCIVSGLFSEGFSAEALGVNGMFTGIVCALAGPSLYCAIDRRLPRFVRLYTDGADREFNGAIMTILPSILVVLVFALVNLIFVRLFAVSGLQSLLINLLNRVFSDMGRSLGTALLFEFFSAILWFFGLHGSDVLDTVSQHIFIPAMDINQQLIQNGQAATEIYSKTFFDVFVVMGGCGTTICLLIALLLFSKRRSNRNLARFAALPMLFNINEIMVFGLPIVFNPILLIPFLLTPLVLLLISSFAMQIGLVPVPVASVEWTTPILLGGYLATNSLAGSALQLFNIVVGVLIYRPFIRLFDAEKQRNAQHRMGQVLRLFQQSEAEGHPLELMAVRDPLGSVTKALAEDIGFRLESKLPVMYYQPQYDSEGRCVGAEALLRWNHPLYGMVYPPMIIQLAQETGQLDKLERAIFCAVKNDLEPLLERLGEEAVICVNVSGSTIQTEEFEAFLGTLKTQSETFCRHVCIEVTEQTALQINEALIERLTRIHEMGYILAIDDFSMGSTSIKYLQSSVFSVIKLDGSLSRDVVNNTRSREIIASITSLSETFGIQVLAEYVETEEQRAILERVGCRLYQGYLYSPAIPLDALGSRQA